MKWGGGGVTQIRTMQTMGVSVLAKYLYTVNNLGCTYVTHHQVYYHNNQIQTQISIDRNWATKFCMYKDFDWYLSV